MRYVARGALILSHIGDSLPLPSSMNFDRSRAQPGRETGKVRLCRRERPRMGNRPFAVKRQRPGFTHSGPASV
jgi:hypothetical protein